MTFRGKEWKRNGNHYNLVGTNVVVYQWNSGANANFLIEVRGLNSHKNNTITVPGKGPEARDFAIAKALEIAKGESI